MKKYVAVFDWDKTIQRSYSFTTWSNLLVEKGIIDKEFLTQNEKIILEPLKSGTLNNDQLADAGMKLFSKYLKGVNIEDTKSISDEYKKANSDLIYSIMRDKIFPFLKNKNIEIIIISGAPQEALEAYRDEFGIGEIYAVKHDVQNGKYLDSFQISTGTTKGKEEMVNHICRNNKEILFAFGDSISDIPVFKSSKYSFVNNNEKFFKGNNVNYFDFSNPDAGERIVQIMEKTLRQLGIKTRINISIDR